MTEINPDNPKFDLESVFEVDDYLYFYRDWLTDELSDRQVSFLVKELVLTPPMVILDLACGFGRHTNRLAAMGFQVTGIDFMPGFLEIARKDASERGVQVAYLEGDMRKLDYNAAFDRVLLLFTAFGYFEDDENFQVLKNVARALKPGGLFVFDTQSRDAILKELHPSHVTEKDGNLMIDRITFDPLSGRLYNHRIVIRDGVRRDKPFFIRMYSPTEVRDLLQRVGLEVFRIYGGWGDDSGAPSLTSESRRMVVIAQKPG